MLRTVFMIVTVLFWTLTITLSYILFLWPFDRRNRVYSRALWWWSRTWLWSAGVKLEITGREHLDQDLQGQPFFMAGNHQSALDIPILSVVTRGRVRFAAKTSLFKIPIIGWWMRIKGYTPVDRGSARKSMPALEAMLQRAREKGSDVGQAIFPEGTRTQTGEVNRFKPGAMKLIQRAGLPLMPFAIKGAWNVMPSGSWKLRPGVVQVHLGAPISAEEVKTLPRDELLARVRDFVLQYLPEAAADAPADSHDASAAQEDDRADAVG